MCEGDVCDCNTMGDGGRENLQRKWDVKYTSISIA